MQQNTPDGDVRALVDAETVQQSIDEFRKSLTVIYAYAQFLQRQSRRGPQVPPAEVEERAQVMASAAIDMIDNLKKLEDVCEE